MYSPLEALTTPNDFEFPFTPYPIQQELMEQLYGVLENGLIGVFESPTGTGKSLTLTCAALRWLEDHERLVRQDLHNQLAVAASAVRRLEEDSAVTDDWITAQSAASDQRKKLLELREVAELLEQHDQQLRNLRERQSAQKQSKRRSLHKSQHDKGVIANADEVLEDYSEELEDLAAEEAENGPEIAEDGNVGRYRDVQIFFCSRTHTQLSQVVRELKRTVYAKRVRCVSLASRQQLCIHKQLRRLPNVALINERCLDMAKSEGQCDSNDCLQKGQRAARTAPLLEKCVHKSQSLVEELSDLSLVNVLDIEELVSEGEHLKACPYYAVRSATSKAQLVMMPYQLLLHRRTRLQSGIDLRGAVVIIDEAHNLLDSIAQMYSCELSLKQLLLAQQQILAYKMRYGTRFSATNLLAINQLLFVVKRLLHVLQREEEHDKLPSTRILCTYELMSEGDFFNIDLFQLLEFCERTRFAQKLLGFSRRPLQEPISGASRPLEKTNSAAIGLLLRLQQENQQKQHLSDERENKTGNDNEVDHKVKDTKPLASPIRPLLAFLEALTEKAEDGRVILNIADHRTSQNSEISSSFKYILLNPGAHFQDIVHEARSIIVAGGTMQPTSELTGQLFHSNPDRVRLHFYDHVVPEGAVLPFVVPRGPSGRALCFNYEKRGSSELLSDLGAVLENLCSVVPAGLVCFLPSYDYLDAVYAQLSKSDVLARISKKKRVFRESRQSSRSDGCSVEQLLEDYANTIRIQQSGALLLSVVGGKLSEGLNFADDLGRGVMVVGMPYPNRQSPELRERMSYLDSRLGAGSGHEYYENLCMKAVNQCIGRSVRHIRDYACVFLLDERYAREAVQRKLPHWISRHLQVAQTYGKVQAATARFFKRKQ